MKSSQLTFLCVLALSSLSFAQAAFNKNDPNLDTLDGQYVDQYATPKSDPKVAELYHEEAKNAPVCLDCRRWSGDIFKNTHVQSSTTTIDAPKTNKGTDRGE